MECPPHSNRGDEEDWIDDEMFLRTVCRRSADKNAGALPSHPRCPSPRSSGVRVWDPVRLHKPPLTHLATKEPVEPLSQA